MNGSPLLELTVVNLKEYKMGKVKEKMMDHSLGMDLACLAIICCVIGLPVMIIMKAGWCILLFLMAYLILGLMAYPIAKNLRRSKMNVFKIIKDLFDLEERHTALIKYLDLKEILIPRHWKIEKAKTEAEV